MNQWETLPSTSRVVYWNLPDHVPAREAEDPIRAWKLASYHDGWFQPLHTFAPYKATAVAQCMVRDETRMMYLSDGRPHGPAPQLHCSCGFYGVKTPGGPLAHLQVYGMGYLLLEVNFSGVIIAHERGYRAERQQVLTAYAPWNRFAQVGDGLERPAEIERATGVPVRKIDQDTCITWGVKTDGRPRT